jgi:subtilisin-like proprotein convertase family protein
VTTPLAIFYHCNGGENNRHWVLEVIYKGKSLVYRIDACQENCEVRVPESISSVISSISSISSVSSEIVSSSSSITPGPCFKGDGFTIQNLTTNFSDIVITGHPEKITCLMVILEDLKGSSADQLICRLEHIDTGTVVDLFHQSGGTKGFVGNYRFADQFSNTFCFFFTSLFIPEEDYHPTDDASCALSFLSAFNGESFNGRWRLSIEETVGFQVGSLGCWQLCVCPLESSESSFSCTSLGPVIVDPGTLNYCVGDTVSFQFTANDPDSTKFIWIMDQDDLPPGLSMSSSGLVTGTITGTGGTFLHFLEVCDECGNCDDISVFWRIGYIVVNNITKVGCLGGTENLEVLSPVSNTSVEFSGITYSIKDGCLPPGLFLNTSSGVIYGTFLELGNYTATILAKGNTTGCEGCGTFTWSVEVCSSSSFSSTSISSTPGPCFIGGGGTIPKGTLVPLASGVAFFDIVITGRPEKAECIMVVLEGLSHPTASLTARLIHLETSTEVVLFSGAGGSKVISGDYRFADQFTDTFCAQGSPVPPGDYHPTEFFACNLTFLSVFTNEPFNGTWRLRITNSSVVTDGTLDQWQLCVCPPIESSSVSISCTSSRPSIAPIPDQVNCVLDSVSLQVEAHDPDSTTITYSASGLPSGLFINPNTGLISGSISVFGGVFNVTVSVCDECGCTDIDFQWTVGAVFNDPVDKEVCRYSEENISILDAGLTNESVEGNSFTFTITAGSLPPGLTLNTGPGTITGTFTELGTYCATIKSEGDVTGCSDTDEFCWTVLDCSSVSSSSSSSSSPIAPSSAASDVSKNLIDCCTCNSGIDCQGPGLDKMPSPLNLSIIFLNCVFPDDCFAAGCDSPNACPDISVTLTFNGTNFVGSDTFFDYLLSCTTGDLQLLPKSPFTVCGDVGGFSKASANTYTCDPVFMFWTNRIFLIEDVGGSECPCNAGIADDSTDLACVNISITE